MSNNESKDPKSMEWMYEGPKSNVNREDYLLGKKIDKNYELFSDVVIKDKAEEEKDELFRKNRAQHTATTATNTTPAFREKVVKTSALDLTVVRTEDPLVALKMREEQRKREMFENPLLKLKAQKVLKEAYERQIMQKKEKKLKKEKKQKRAKSYSSSSSFEHSRKKKQRSASRDKNAVKNKLSPRSAKSERKHDRVVRKPRSPTDKRYKEQSPEHRNYSFKKHISTHRHAAESQTSAKEEKQSSSQASKFSREEELEAKRAEMLSNAKWRDEVRNETIDQATIKLRKEEEQLGKGNSAFLKPLLESAARSSSSVEKRLHSNKKNLQKSYDYMERSFTSRKM